MVQPEPGLVNWRAPALAFQISFLRAEIAEQEEAFAFTGEEGPKQYLEKLLKEVQTFDLE